MLFSYRAEVLQVKSSCASVRVFQRLSSASLPMSSASLPVRVSTEELFCGPDATMGPGGGATDGGNDGPSSGPDAITEVSGGVATPGPSNGPPAEPYGHRRHELPMHSHIANIRNMGIDVSSVAGYELRYVDDRRMGAERIYLKVSPRAVWFTGWSNAQSASSSSGYHMGTGGSAGWTHSGDGTLRLNFNYRGDRVEWRVNLVMVCSTPPDAAVPRWTSVDARPIYVQLEYLWFDDGRSWSLEKRAWME